MAKASTDAERIAREYINMWTDQEYSKIPDLVSESFVLYDPAAPGGEIHGRDGLEEFMRGVLTGFPDLQVTIVDILSSDEVVLCETTLAGTHDGEFAGTPPTGREVEIQALEKFHIEDGTIQEHRVCFNQDEFFEQLGLSEE